MNTNLVLKKIAQLSEGMAEELKETIQARRSEAYDILEECDEAEKAWQEHDYDYLRETGWIR